MKLRRTPQPAPVDREFVELISGLYYAFEDNLERCGRLTERQQAGTPPEEFRDEALGGARRIAYVSRVTFEVMANLMATQSVPEEILPVGIYGALARLAYALTGLAEAEPAPDVLLSRGQLDNLTAQYQIQDWVARGRERNPGLSSEAS